MTDRDHTWQDAGQHDPAERRGWTWHSLAIAGIVLVAFLVRSYGLSHDLDQGKIYHPDTPKQIRMAARYADGVFYYETGIRNYDGFPYFTSLIAAGAYRVVAFVADGVRGHLGVRVESGVDRAILLNWITLFLNVLMSTMSVWVLYRLGRRVTRPGLALAAAFFLALSPIDLVACHYASGESAAALFALVSLFFAVRIYQTGRYLDYILSAAFSLCAFSARYHAGLVGFSLIAAHILRVGSFKGLFTKGSLLRTGAVLATVIVFFFLTNPGTLVKTSRGIDSILVTLQRQRHFAKTEEALGLTGFTRFVFGRQVNVPVFADFLTPLLFACGLAGVAAAFVSDKRRRVVAVLPLAYGLIGLSSKTAENPVYSTLITPAMFLLATVTLDDLMAIKNWRPAPRILGRIMLLVGALMLANATWQEMFFSWNPDTRMILGRWLRDNTPDFFTVTPGRRSYLDRDLTGREGPVSGMVRTRSHPRDSIPGNYFLFHRVRIENVFLSLFRNPPVDVYVREGQGLDRRWQLPVFQKIPAAPGEDLILADSFDFYRSARIFPVSPDKDVRKTLLAWQALEDAVVVVRGGHLPTRVEVEIGGKRRAWRLAADEVAWSDLKHLRRRLPLLSGPWAYRVSARSSDGPAQVTIALTPEEKGMALFQIGEYAGAERWLSAAPGNPTVDAAALACRRLLSRKDGGPAPLMLAHAEKETLDAADLPRLFGLTESYLAGLPYLAWTARELDAEGFRCEKMPELYSGDVLVAEQTTNAMRSVSSPLVMLPGGCYTMRLQLSPGPWVPADEPGARATPVPVRVSLRDAVGRTVWSGGELKPAAEWELFECASTAFQKPEHPMSVRLVVEFPAAYEPVIRELSVRPDPVTAVNSLRRAVGALASGASPLSAAGPANYDLLMATASTLAGRGDAEGSRPYYAAAARACPNRMEPLEALARTPREARGTLPDDVAPRLDLLSGAQEQRKVRPVGSAFSGGIRLAGYSLTTGNVKAGEAFGLKLLWDVTDFADELNHLGVWVHMVDARGQVSFQGDHDLAFDLMSPANVRNFGTEDFCRISVPAEARPGPYTIRVGLCIPHERNRLRVESGSLPVAKRGVEIGRVTVE